MRRPSQWNQSLYPKRLAMLINTGYFSCCDFIMVCSMHNHTFCTSYRSSNCGSKLALVNPPKEMSCDHVKATSIVTNVHASSSVDRCLRELRTPLVKLPVLCKKKIIHPFFCGFRHIEPWQYKIFPTISEILDTRAWIKKQAAPFL